jgi:hypothetical protein
MEAHMSPTTPRRRPPTVTSGPARAAGGLVAALAGLLALPACAADSPEERDFGAVAGALVIAADTADLDIRTADTGALRVVRHVTGPNTAEEWGYADGTLTLPGAHCPVLPDAWCGVRYEVHVPEGTDLTVEGGSGAVSSTGHTGPLAVTTDNGAIDVEAASGPLRLEAGSGAVHASGLTSERVSAATENGAVDLALAAAATEVRVATENGEVVVEVPDAPYAVTTETDSGEIRSDVPEDPAAPHTLHVTTDNGAITLLAGAR